MPIDVELLARLSSASRATGSDLSAADISQISTAYETIDKLGTAYGNYKIDSILERAYSEAGGLDGEFRFVSKFLRDRVELSNLSNEELTVLDQEGNPSLIADSGRSRAATVADLIEELKDASDAFAKHFGYQGKAETSTPGVDNDLSPWERLSMAREKARTAAR